MNIEATTEYQEALHFCVNNTPEVIARNMARDMLKVKEQREQMERAAIACAHGESRTAQEILNQALGLPNEKLSGPAAVEPQPSNNADAAGSAGAPRLGAWRKR